MRIVLSCVLLARTAVQTACWLIDESSRDLLPKSVTVPSSGISICAI